MASRKIADIMSHGCVTVTPQDNIYEAAVKMRDHDIGFVPVVESEGSDKLIGVITDRDLVVRGYADKHSGSTSVMEVLTRDVETIGSDTSVDEAAARMAAGQIRRLPVVDGGRLKGVVSLGDLAVREIFVNEAGVALSDISEHTHTEQQMTH